MPDLRDNGADDAQPLLQPGADDPFRLRQGGRDGLLQQLPRGGRYHCRPPRRGVRRSSKEELTQWTAWAAKVITSEKVGYGQTHGSRPRRWRRGGRWRLAACAVACPGRTGWGWSSGPPVSAFRPRISCFVELGDGIAAYASGDFYAEGGPGMNPQAPREDLALEQSGD